MVDARDIQEWLLQLTRKLWSWLSPTGLGLLLDLARRLYRSALGAVPAGMYEILDYDSTLVLCDPRGKRAVFRKRQQVKFLQDNIIAFPDYAWGDGEIFADYRCSPGKEVDRYQEGDRWNVLISLRTTKMRGELMDFRSERVVNDGFTKDEEWKQVEIRHPTRRLRLAVLFPRQRHCRRAILHLRGGHRDIVLGQEAITDLPDGRQMVSWETSHIKRFEVYTLRWWW